MAGGEVDISQGQYASSMLAEQTRKNQNADGTVYAPVNTSRAWLTVLVLSAASMMIETIAYRQWRVFLRMDPLPFLLPLVMAGMAAGAIAFYLLKRKRTQCSAKSSPRPLFISRLLLLYAAVSPAPFLLLPLSTNVQSPAGMFLEGGSTVSCFFLFGVWGYVNAALFDQCRHAIFMLYSGTVLGTILGACSSIVLMDTYGTPVCISFSVAAAVITAWVWAVMNPSTRPSARYRVTVVALSAIAAGFVLPSASLTIFHGKEAPVWFDSNSFSQLEIYPVEPLNILRAPSLRAAAPESSNVRAWRVYFDGLDFYHTNIVRYRNLEEVKFLSQDISSLAFLIGNPKRVLILGAGGGLEVIQALLAGCSEIDAVDINPLVVKAVQHAEASDFMSVTGVHYHIADARSFLLRDRANYDLIFMPNVRGQGVAGVINAQYMNTFELTNYYLDNISPGGALVIRSYRHDWPSLLSTLKAVVTKRPAPETWSIFLASETHKKRASGLVIMRQGPFTAVETGTISKFIEEGGFNWSQIDLNRVDNTFVLTNDHPYAMNPENLFNQGDMPGVIRNSSISADPKLIRFAIPLGAALVIILSLAAIHAGISRPDIRRLLIMGRLYFAGLGSGFLAAEIVLIEKTFLVAGNPTIAFGITVSALLGGALLAIWLFRKIDSQQLAALLPKIALAAAFALGMALIALEKLAFVLVFPDWLKVPLAGFVIVATGILMGVLFPSGLRLLAEVEPDSIPWNWAINGVGAVAGGIIAELMAIILGYRAAMGFAAACYVLAALASIRIAALMRTA